MLKDLVQFGSRNSGTADENGFIAETTLSGWLRQVAGYEDPNKAVLRPKSFPGRRDWFEVEHAQSGQICVFHCSDSGKHTAQTVRERGGSLRMVCRETTNGTPWWFTAEEGNGGASTGVSFTLGGLKTGAPVPVADPLNEPTL